MKQHTLSITLVAGLALAACGGGGSDQDQVADLLIEAAADAGASPDADCIRDLAQDISDDDAEAMTDAGLQGDPDISEAAGEILAEMLLC